MEDNYINEKSLELYKKIMDFCKDNHDDNSPFHVSASVLILAINIK